MQVFLASYVAGCFPAAILTPNFTGVYKMFYSEKTWGLFALTISVP
jgi:hypothetical protein